MGRTRYDEMACSIARTLDVIGDAWTPLILRDLAIGISRFDVLQRDLGISRKVLSQRLDELERREIVDRVPYQQNPPRHDYRLTQRGAELVMVLVAMQSWGDRWVFGEADAPVVLRHEGCGEITRPVLTCTGCGGELRPGEVTPLPGPGLRVGPGTAESPAALERLREATAAGGT